MKRILLLMLICALFLSGCVLLPGYSKDKLFAYVPPYESEEFYTNGTFQDYTDYGIYTYKPFDYEKAFNGTLFSRVTSANREALLDYIADFEKWVDAAPDDNELHLNYNFDHSILSEGDYFRFTEKDYFYDYSFYIFDAESYTMYYFHNNI